jgi:TP901 family phage tail tape measure protein
VRVTDRTVTTRLAAETAAYDGPIVASSKTTSALASAQRDAAAAAKVAASEQRATAMASREAADAASAAAKQVAAAKAEQAQAAKAAGAADAMAAKAVTDADRAEVLSAQETARVRKAAADEGLAAARSGAAATAETASASKSAALAASKDALAKRDVAAAAREAAIAEAADAAATDEAAKKRSEAYTNTGKKLAIAGAVLAAGFIEAEKATASFDKSLSGVQAVSQASAAEMGKLRTAALQAGADTAFTATQAADAEAELVKAGVSVADTLNGGLKGALSLAAAGQLDLADAAIISANAMNTFALKGSDVSHIADVYAAAANKSAADVKELGYAMQQGGLVASQTGLTFEDTTAVLAAFSDRALKGADGGTSLKTMLEKLNAPSKQAAGLMDALGIVTYDASGKFVGITQLAGELHDKLGPLTDAQRNQTLATIFGSDAIRGATILYNLGAQGIQGYKDAVNDNGAAARMAAAQMDNLSGDLEQLGGSLETALIKGGSGATSALRDLTQQATDAVNAFSHMPDWLQQTAVGFTGGSGGALLLVGGLSSVVGKAGAASKAMKETAEASKGLKSVMANAGSFMAGPWGIAIAGAAVALTLLTTSHHRAVTEVASFTEAMKQDGDAIGKATTAAVAADPQIAGLYSTFGKLGISATTVTDAVLGSKDALGQVTTATNAAIQATDTNKLAGIAYANWLRTGVATIQDYHAGLVGQLKTQQQVTAATGNSSAALGESSLATQKAAQESKDAAAASASQAAGQRALTDAENAGAFTTGAATEKKKAATSTSRFHTAAMRDEARVTDDAAKREADAAAAADKHTTALYKAADSAKAAAAAAAKNSDANADGAKKTADEAEAAAEASEVHQAGAKWLREVADAEVSASGSARDLDDSVKDEVSAFKEAKDKATSLKDALDALNGVHIAASRAAIDVQDKVANLTKTLHENGTTLDITSDKGRANMGVVLDLAQAINSHAQAVAEESGSVEAGNKALDASRDEFDKVLKSAGFSKDAIQHFNDTLLNTPKLTEVKITADTSAAAAKLQALVDRFGYIQVQAVGGSGGRAAFATGGLVDGVGTGTSDSNMVAVSKKEYIVNAAAVARPGVLAALNSLNFGTGSATVVKPQIPMRAMAASPSASVGAGSGFHIENYFENGQSPMAVAQDLAWLATARGQAL